MTATKGGTMTAEELEQIRGRHQARFGSHGAAITASQCDLDRARLVREVDHLTAELAEARGEVERYGNWLRWISKVQGLPEAGISGDILAALAGDAGEL